MTTTADKGIYGGITARLKAGSATGWGVFHPGSKAMILGGLMLIVSAFLPWVYLPFMEQVTGETYALRGTDGPGVMTLAVGFRAFAGGFVPRRRLAIAHAAIPGLRVAGIVLLQSWNILAFSASSGAWGGLLPGMGLVLAGGGAVVLLKSAWTMYRTWLPA